MVWKMVRDIAFEEALGDGVKRIYEGEIPMREVRRLSEEIYCQKRPPSSVHEVDQESQGRIEEFQWKATTVLVRQRCT